MQYICIGLGDNETQAAVYEAMFEAQALALGLPTCKKGTSPCN